MAAPQHQLPARICLRAGDVLLDHASVLILLGQPTRMTLSNWRRLGRNGAFFPRSWKHDNTHWVVAESFADWCRSQGCTVDYVYHQDHRVQQ